MADAAFGVMLEKKLDTLGGMLFVDYTGTLTRNRSFSGDLRTYDSLTDLNFDRRLISRNPSQWHGITADIALPYNKHGEVDFGLMTNLAPERKDVDATVDGLTDSLRSYAYTNSTYELSAYIGAQHHFGSLTLAASVSFDNAWYNLQYPGADSGNPYNPSVSESTTESRYVSFGLTWRLGRTEMEAQQTHGKKEPRKKSK